MGDIDKFKVETYDGTIESAKKALENLNVHDSFYHFDVQTGWLILHKKGLMLRPGDSYQYLLPQKEIEAV